MKKIRIGLCQMMVIKTTKRENIEKARTMIYEATDKGAQIVVLPEMFNCPYSIKHFREYAETYPKGETLTRIIHEVKFYDFFCKKAHRV
jgi:predicted amidohydrolase